jgi:TRAP-type C4-dicarboxylate transport system permease small subunit
METLVIRLKGKLRHISEIFYMVALLFYSVILTLAGFMLVTDTFGLGARTVMLKVPIYAIQLAMVVGAIALAIKLLLQITIAVREAIVKTV